MEMALGMAFTWFAGLFVGFALMARVGKPPHAPLGLLVACAVCSASLAALVRTQLRLLALRWHA